MSIQDPVFDLIIHPSSSPDQVLWAARASGLYNSRDQAQTWQYAYQSLLGDTRLPSSALALANKAPGSDLLLSGGPGAILCSEDEGLTWKISRLPDPEPVVVALAASPHFSQDGTAFAATEQDGVFMTNDQGASWMSWNYGLLDMQSVSLVVSPHFSFDQQVFVGVSTGLFRSLNRGRSWMPVELPCGYDPVLSLALSPAFGEDGMGFAGTENSGLLRTVDGGMTWQLCAGEFLNGSINKVALDPTDPLKSVLVALVDGELFISRDQGSKWEPWNIPGLPQDFEITTFTAPQGFQAGMPLCLGDKLGRVLFLRAP